MLHLKEMLAFPVYGTAVWLMYILSQLADTHAITVTLSGLVLIGFAAWLYNVTYLSSDGPRRWGVGFSALTLTGAVGLLVFVGDRNQPSASDKNDIAWQSFSSEKLENSPLKRKSSFRRLHGDVVHYMQGK